MITKVKILRIAFLRALRQRKQLSPSEFSRDSGAPLANASYHTNMLLGAGVIEVTATVARRGALEHRYSFSGPRAAVVEKMMDFLAKH